MSLQGILENYQSRRVEDVRICNCTGPQNGEPVCPCAMRSVKIKNGRYVQEHDLGPAPKGAA